jgi:hypothetical protein
MAHATPPPPSRRNRAGFSPNLTCPLRLATHGTHSDSTGSNKAASTSPQQLPAARRPPHRATRPSGRTQVGAAVLSPAIAKGAKDKLGTRRGSSATTDPRHPRQRRASPAHDDCHHRETGGHRPAAIAAASCEQRPRPRHARRSRATHAAVVSSGHGAAARDVATAASQRR